MVKVLLMLLMRSAEGINKRIYFVIFERMYYTDVLQMLSGNMNAVFNLNPGQFCINMFISMVI